MKKLFEKLFEKLRCYSKTNDLIPSVIVVVVGTTVDVVLEAATDRLSLVMVDTHVVRILGEGITRRRRLSFNSSSNMSCCLLLQVTRMHGPLHSKAQMLIISLGLNRVRPISKRFILWILSPICSPTIGNSFNTYPTWINRPTYRKRSVP